MHFNYMYTCSQAHHQTMDVLRIATNPYLVCKTLQRKVKRGFPCCNTFCLRLSAISVCKMAAKRRKLDMPAVEEVQLDSATSDGDYDSDKEVYEGCVSAQ